MFSITFVAASDAGMLIAGVCALRDGWHVSRMGHRSQRRNHRRLCLCRAASGGRGAEEQHRLSPDDHHWCAQRSVVAAVHCAVLSREGSAGGTLIAGETHEFIFRALDAEGEPMDVGDKDMAVFSNKPGLQVLVLQVLTGTDMVSRRCYSVRPSRRC